MGSLDYMLKSRLEVGKSVFTPGLNGIEKNEEEGFPDPYEGSGLIMPEIYDHLPFVFRDTCRFFEGRRKDIFFTSAISLISGTMGHVSGEYFQQKVHPNLYSYIVAPPASGKNAMSWARKLIKYCIQDVQDRMMREMQEYEELKRTKEGKNAEKPPIRLFFIPANNSASGIIELLNHNGSCVICETESDTVANTFKQDWGNYSDLLRKAFHHECIDMNRRTNREYISIENPQLSVCITCTPDQIAGVFKDAKNGLFSRFLFYAFSDQSVWIDPFSHSAMSEEMHRAFENASRIVHERSHFRNSLLTFEFSTHQIRAFNHFFQKWMVDGVKIYGRDAEGMVKRLGLSFFRMCMVLGNMESDPHEFRTSYGISQDLFEIAMLIVDTYRNHSFRVYDTLSNEKPASPNQGKGTIMSRLFSDMPDSFTTSKALEWGANNKVSEASIKKALAELVKRQAISREKHGTYEKSKV
jgi:hypothetical protein